MSVPTTTESMLDALAASTAENEAHAFVRSMNRLEARLGEEADPLAFEELRQELVACRDTAKQHLEHYDRLTDIWRGAEFNLGQFLAALEGERRQDVLTTAVQDERRRVDAEMDAEAARTAAIWNEMESTHAFVAQHEMLVAPAPAVVAAPAAPTAPAAPAAPALPTSIPELIARVNNEAQKQSLSKLLLRTDANQIYLSAYEANTLTRGRGSEVEGTFTVLGTMRQGTRESYTVKWYRWTGVHPSFWCNCPDHKFNSARKHMVCKHICFLVTKVGRILDPAFFADFQFTAEQHRAFNDTVGNVALFTSAAPIIATPMQPARPSLSDRRAQFLEARRPVGAEDACPICYDEMGVGACLNCPTCSNNVHRECMEVWLERHSTCVFCRSDVWRFWNA